MSRFDELMIECARLELRMDGAPAETIAGLDAFEDSTSFQLPPDFRFFIENHDRRGRYGRSHTVHVPAGQDADTMIYGDRDGPVLFTDNPDEGRFLQACMDQLDPAASTPFWQLLVGVTIAEHHGSLLLDYRYDPVNPPVIRLISDVSSAQLEPIPSTPEFPFDSSWIEYVAPSFTDMLKQMPFEGPGNEPPRRDGRPYPFGEQVIAWRKSMFDYLTEHRGVVNPIYMQH